MLDFLIEHHKKMEKAMIDPLKPWNIGHDYVTNLAKQLSDIHQENSLILKAIRKEIVPNCRHPKEMHDKTKDGQFYCMNCNMDL